MAAGIGSLWNAGNCGDLCDRLTRARGDMALLPGFMALLMSAGIASAEVSVGGDGRMGVRSTDGGDAMFSSLIRISFSASGETDNG